MATTEPGNRYSVGDPLWALPVNDAVDEQERVSGVAEADSERDPDEVGEMIGESSLDGVGSGEADGDHVSESDCEIEAVGDGDLGGIIGALLTLVASEIGTSTSASSRTAENAKLSPIGTVTNPTDKTARQSPTGNVKLSEFPFKIPRMTFTQTDSHCVTRYLSSDDST
jgi:hypothetical protein